MVRTIVGLSTTPRGVYYVRKTLYIVRLLRPFTPSYLTVERLGLINCFMTKGASLLVTSNTVSCDNHLNIEIMILYLWLAYNQKPSSYLATVYTVCTKTLPSRQLPALVVLHHEVK